MCVDAGSRAALMARGTFVGALAAVAAPLALPAEAQGPAAQLPPPPANLSRANATAATLAQGSTLVRTTFARVESLAASITDARLRSPIAAFIRQPRHLYAEAHPSPASRTAVRDALARAGFVAADAPVEGIFPPGTEVTAVRGVQPFWSTPGSSEGSHHAYPGGLAIHEYFNASMATAYASTYDRIYFGGRANVNRDVVIAAALYHDIMKTVVFQWREDGTLTDELTIAGTGAHHVLSAAEAIAHGQDARFVTTLLAAHAAPSLGDEAKVAAWAEAAAIVAGVDPVAYGLLRETGPNRRLGADPVPLEAFINHLSDHDYVVSIHAMHVVGDRLRDRYGRIGALAQLAPTFAWYRASILSRISALALYDTLSRRGPAAFDAELARVEAGTVPVRLPAA